MNCKPGDMALVIKAYPRDVGKAVTCLRLAGPRINTPYGPFVTRFGLKPIWEIDRAMTWRMSRNGPDVLLSYMPDEYLMPIRPEPDEQHVITGKIRVTSIDTKVLEQILLGDQA